MRDEKKIDAAETARELTIALFFLEPVAEGRGKEEYWPWQAWKWYDFDTLNEFEEKDFTRSSHRAKSLTLTNLKSVFL